MIAPLCLLVRLVSFVDVFVCGWFSLRVSVDATHHRSPRVRGACSPHLGERCVSSPRTGVERCERLWSGDMREQS